MLNNSHKGNDEISKEWDNIAKFRLNQLENREDISMDNIIIPTIFRMADGTDKSKVIDLGCGTGYATKRFSSFSRTIVGVDISKKSIIVAKKNKKEADNIEYINSSIEEFSILGRGKFTLAISNMTFMDVANLDKVVESTSDLIEKGGHLIMTITHPYFWPFYWDYANEDWFNYSMEIGIENLFRISNSTTNFKTTHFHRPLETYINTLVKNSLVIKDFIEPMPSKEVEKLYKKKWKFPRFLALKCQKIN